MFFKYVAERVEKKILQWEKIDTSLASPNLKLMQIKMPTIFKTSSKKQKIKKPSKARTKYWELVTENLETQVIYVKQMW